MIFPWTRLNILVLGTDGMLGHDVYQMFRRLSSERGSGIGTVYGMGREELDENHISERYGLSSFFLSYDRTLSSDRIDVCVNCIAMTDTKAAETTSEGNSLSYTANALIPKYVAEACAFAKVHLIHISTDYVFSEKSMLSASPYPDISETGFRDEFSPFVVDPWPVNVYGTHKLDGECFVKSAYAAKGRKNWTILRTSWLYGMHRNKSFVHRLLVEAFKSTKTGTNAVEMTENEVSVPTSTDFVCKCVLKAALNGLYGVRHAVPVQGIVSRTDWSRRVLSVFFSGTPTSVFKAKVNIVGVKRSGLLQPEFSALATSEEFEEFGTMDNCLLEFLLKNWEELAKWASSQA